MKPWLAGMLVLGLVACDPGGPNGKKEVLFFWSQESLPLAEGFSATLTVPRQTSLGGGKGLSRHETFSFDFADTSLAVSTDPGLAVEKTWLDDEGYHVTYRCEPAEKSSREVRVQVLAPDGDERYADAFDVRCGRPQALQVLVSSSEYSPEGPASKFMLGATVTADVTLVGHVDGQESMPLAGGQVRLVDPEGLVFPRTGPGWESDRRLSMETVRAGRSPRVTLAGLEAELPMEIVEDSAFHLEVTSTYSTVAPPLWTLTSNARHVDGSRVGGLSDCEFDIRPLSGTPYTERGCYTYVKGDIGPGTACVRARGKSACAEYTR